MELSQALVRELFDYQDGRLFYLLPKKGRQMSKEVGTLHVSGYLVVRINYKLYKLHRIIFLMHHGFMPNIVDHANMDRSDNRIENLRPATKSQNMGNRAKQNNNTSGFKGVWFHAASGKWCASIKVNGQKTNLGSFETPEAAHESYASASTKSFGEFSRVI